MFLRGWIPSLFKSRNTVLFEPEEPISISTIEWTPVRYKNGVTALNTTHGQCELGASLNAASGIERLKVDVAEFLLSDSHADCWFRQIALSAMPTVCTFGEIDFSNTFHPLGCATFLSSGVLLTAYHVVCAISDGSKVRVRIEWDVSAKSSPNGGLATCRECLLRVDVVNARHLQDRDITILILDRNTALTVEGTLRTNFQCRKLTVGELDDFVLVLHTENGTKHTVADIGEIPTSNFGAQIATNVISNGTFGTCGAAVFNTDGLIAGVYIGAEWNQSYIKGVMSIHDIIANEFEKYDNSILVQFVASNQRFIRTTPATYYDWIDPRTRTKGYVKEGTQFEAIRQRTSSHELCVLECLGIGGKHADVLMYSNLRNIESDHFPPFNAYELSVLGKKYFRAGRTRLCADELPTISLPYSLHKELITTGSSHATKQFAQDLSELMGTKEGFKKAIMLNIAEYEKVGLFKAVTFMTMYSAREYGMTNEKAIDLVQKYKVGIKKALLQHEALGFITEAGRLDLEKYTQERH